MSPTAAARRTSEPTQARRDATKPLDNPRHEAFAQAVAGGLSFSAAYRKAGYDSKSPEAHGSRLASSGSIAARIATLKVVRTTAAVKASTVDAARIQRELESLSFSDIGQLFEEDTDEDGASVARVLPITKWPGRVRRAVSAIKVRRYLEGPPDNQREVELLEFKLWNKGDGLRQLREHMGLVKPAGEVTVNVGVIAMPMIQTPIPPASLEVVQAQHKPPADKGARLRALASTLEAPQL